MEFSLEIEPKKAFVTGTNPTNFLTTSKHGIFAKFHLLTPSTEMGQSDLLIVVDANRDSLKAIKRLKLRPEHCVLIRNEPAVVCPLNYAPETVELFSKVIDIGRSLPDSTLSVPCPQTWPEDESFQWRGEVTRSEKPVLMNANKLSFIRGELYSLRRLIIHRFDIDLYGPRWGSSLLARLKTTIGELAIFLNSDLERSKIALRYWWSHHPNYKGISADKYETYRKYKIAIALENSPDYMSEKLIDALLAGCVPIYCGPDVSEYGIPQELVISCTPDLEGVQNGLEQAEKIDYPQWQSKTREYLIQTTTKRYWSPERIYLCIAEHIF